MAAPYVPTAFSTPVISPSAGSVGANPIPYVSISEYQFAPTAMAIGQLVPGGFTTTQLQSLADVIRRASRWADNICFGADPDGKASLAASVSVESQWAKVVNGALRLACDYRPIEVVGIDVGASPTSVSSVGATVAAQVRIGRRTIVVPLAIGSIFRSKDVPAITPYATQFGRVYAVWSYVNGFPHTKLHTSVLSGATTCVVTATNGAGGLWGVYAASGAFLGTQLQIIDGVNTETVSVKSITAGTTTTTLTTSAFQHAHTVPTAPDFIPVTQLPEDIHQACITLTSALIKSTRGSRTMEMARAPGQPPSRQVMAQAGALGNWENACDLLHDYGIRQKLSKVI
ncbi:MAG TPA: hypothetical protein VNG12_18440 [Acidimicrobiales bacterium]|nr:hypothetical protein [Acidimicrobiales bacterium]